MSAFNLDEDTLTAIICVLAGAYAIWRGMGRAKQGRKGLAGMWFAAAIALMGMAVFLMTFTIRLF